VKCCSYSNVLRVLKLRQLVLCWRSCTLLRDVMACCDEIFPFCSQGRVTIFKLIFLFSCLAGNEYNEGTLTHHHQAPNGSNSSPNDIRQAHNFYPAFPQSSGGMVNSGIPSTDPISHVSVQASSHSAVVVATSKLQEEEDDNVALFGDLPEAKRRKFILVDDAQRGTRVRVRVMLDQVRMAEMPDSYRKINSVYPRSWFATEMQSPPPSPRRGRWPDDVGSDESTMSTSRTLVPVPMMDGSETKLPVPQVTRTQRSKEVTLNDLGYRMSWSQSRVFSGRTLFLQRSC
jgi:hypothetical protein